MLSEGAELTGETGKTYLAVAPLGQSNVWTAVENNTNPSEDPHVVVIKEPGTDDTRPGWPNFQNEMIMHELLKDSPAIRQQVDRIPPTKSGDPPMLVLEITETTLWSARTKRPFTLSELKSVTKDALVGLRDVHDQGLVYADLKMENIMVDGFDVHKPSDPDHLSATLGDLGILMEPANGKVQPIVYRAPEVYFKGDITPKADIWGWGLIYCHLLEARSRFSKTGLYDDLNTGNGTMFEREEAVRNAVSNDYKLQNNVSYSGFPLPQNDSRKGKGDQWELLRGRGLEEGEVDFLRWVLRADPRKRPSAEQILQSGWLDKTEEEVAAGFEVPANGVGKTEMEFDPQRASPEEVREQKHLESGGGSNYFIKSNRPLISNKRLHSEEDEHALKKTQAPESRLGTTPEHPIQSTSTVSAGQPTQYTSGISSGQPAPYTSNTSSGQPTPYTSSATAGQTGQYTSSTQSSQPVQYNTTAPLPSVPGAYPPSASSDQPVQFNATAPLPSLPVQDHSTTSSGQTIPYTTISSVQPTQYTDANSLATQLSPSGQSTTTTTTQAPLTRPGISTTNTGTFLSYR